MRCSFTQRLSWSELYELVDLFERPVNPQVRFNIAPSRRAGITMDPNNWCNVSRDAIAATWSISMCPWRRFPPLSRRLWHWTVRSCWISSPRTVLDMRRLTCPLCPHCRWLSDTVEPTQGTDYGT